MNPAYIDLPYGDTTLRLDTSQFPACDVLRPSPLHAPDDDILINNLRGALDAPEQSPPLSQLAAAARTACIVVSDNTRNHGQAIWLPPLLDCLNAAGISDKNITVLIGNGAHGALTREEKRVLLGEAVTGRVPVAGHDAGDPASVREIGVTRAGTPVRINKLLLDAALRIVTGAVMHHYFAGFTGGRKGIVPGAAARDTIERNHSLTLLPTGGTHPGAATGNLAGNPVHEDMLEAALMAGAAFLVNFVTDPHGRPAAVFAGGLEAAHAKAVRLARQSYEVKIENKYELVIASCGGAPRDVSFYQSHKSLDNAFRATAPGGRIILLARCQAGLGPGDFEKWFRMSDRGAIAAALRKQYYVPGQTALATLKKTRAANVTLISSLPREQARIMNMTPAESLEQALSEIKQPPQSTAIIPHAAYTVPVARTP